MLETADQVVDAAWAAGWRPDPIRTVSDWADKHRRLAPEGSSEPGQWRTSRTPYLREVMDCLSPHHPAREVVMMTSTQIGKTEVGLNWIGSMVEWNPGPMLVVQPTSNVAKRWSKQRLTGMIRETPSLRRILGEKSRDADNATFMKVFPGGMIIVGGANSAPDLSSMPIKYLFLDEVDRYPADVGADKEGRGEGDPVKLAERRTSTFPQRKIFKCSTPTIESLSGINKAWLNSDQRRYFVACPHCTERQVLRWDNLKWPDGRPQEAQYVCEHCGAFIAEHHKPAMLENGEWRAAVPGREVVGFHLNALYTPIGLGESWAEHATEWERIKSDPAARKAFTNTVLGECHKDPNEKLDWQQLQQRAESTPMRVLPKGCLVLTLGVDVQGNRLAVQLVGWGREGRSWVLDWLEIPGDPTRDDVWEKLDEYRLQPLVNAFNVPMRVLATAVDAGYLQDHVLKYTRTRRHANVFAVKGVDTASKTILSTATKPDKNKRGRTSKRSTDLWLVSSGAAKELLFLRLKGDGQTAHAHERMVRFPAGLGEEYYTQLTAEIYDPVKRQWVKQQARNEALDTMVYALAATFHPSVRLHVLREPDWAKLESVLEPQVRDLFNQVPAVPAPPAREAEPVHTPAEPEAPAEKAAPTPKPAAGGWISPQRNWLNRR
jgi:phage terminase large subunit GpA-like protein